MMSCRLHFFFRNVSTDSPTFSAVFGGDFWTMEGFVNGIRKDLGNASLEPWIALRTFLL